VGVTLTFNGTVVAAEAIMGSLVFTLGTEAPNVNSTIAGLAFATCAEAKTGTSVSEMKCDWTSLRASRALKLQTALPAKSLMWRSTLDAIVFFVYDTITVRALDTAESTKSSTLPPVTMTLTTVAEEPVTFTTKSVGNGWPVTTISVNVISTVLGVAFGTRAIRNSGEVVSPTLLLTAIDKNDDTALPAESAMFCDKSTVLLS
jgi:hypothetical protein